MAPTRQEIDPIMMTLAAGTLALLAVLGSAGAAVWLRRRRGEARALYQRHLEQALEDGILTPEEIAGLENLRQRTDLGPAETRMVALAVYRRALREVAEDARVTAEEQARLERLREQLGLAEADLRADRTQEQRIRMLARIEQGELPRVDAPVPLAPDEVCHWVVQGTLCERIAFPARPVAPASLAFEVAGAAPFSVEGKRDPLEPLPSILPVDLGLLLLTDRRVLFHGAKRRISLAHLQLERFLLFGDGLRAEGTTGASQTFLVGDPELTGAILLTAARQRRRAVSRAASG